MDGHFSPDGASVAVSDSGGQLHLYGLGAPSALMARAPYDQFLTTDFNQLMWDAHRHVLDMDTQQPAHILHAAHAAADGERDEHLGSGAGDHVIHGVPVLVRGADVEEGDLVGTLAVIGAGLFHRVAGVAQLDEVDALDDAAVLDVRQGITRSASTGSPAEKGIGRPGGGRPPNAENPAPGQARRRASRPIEPPPANTR